MNHNLQPKLTGRHRALAGAPAGLPAGLAPCLSGRKRHPPVPQAEGVKGLIPGAYGL